VTLRDGWVTLSSLGDTKSSLGDTKSSLGDTKRWLGAPQSRSSGGERRAEPERRRGPDYAVAVRIPRSDVRKLRIGRLARGDRQWPLDNGQSPNSPGVRVHASTGYNRVEGIRRASRNGLVSALPPEIPHVTIRNLSSLYRVSRALTGVSGVRLHPANSTQQIPPNSTLVGRDVVSGN
jgi:hypothetical protein